MLIIDRRLGTPLAQMRAHVSHLPEITEDEIAPGVLCFSVLKGIGNADTYKDDWTREARGITFSALTGEIISRPFHKFFNVGERESTQLDKLKWKNVARVMDKRDGSMIHPVLLDGQIHFKSKKTFESEVAINAKKFADIHTNFLEYSRRLLVEYNATPIFEWTSPANRIVLGYDESELKLLHVRSNEQGYYWSIEEIEILAKEYAIPICDAVSEFNSIEEMVKAAETRTDIEGWVLQFLDGDMVKIKTDWYMARHRAFTFFRERDIVRLVIDEQIDDVKAMLAKDGIDLDQILSIEQRFAEDMRQIIDGVASEYQNHEHLPAKDVAMKFKGHKYFGMIMALHNGKKPDYLGHFEKHMLKENYSLDTLKHQPDVKAV